MHSSALTVRSAYCNKNNVSGWAMKASIDNRVLEYTNCFRSRIASGWIADTMAIANSLALLAKKGKLSKSSKLEVHTNCRNAITILEHDAPPKTKELRVAYDTVNRIAKTYSLELSFVLGVTNRKTDPRLLTIYNDTEKLAKQSKKAAQAIMRNRTH